MRKTKKGLIATILLLSVIASALTVGFASACGYLPPPPCPPPPCPCVPGEVHYLGKDTITKGNWTNATGSPIGVYGSYAHILPDPPLAGLQVPVGNFSVPVGSFTYSDYNWTSTQIAGLPFNRTLPNYWDEYNSLAPPVTYFLTGNLVLIPGIGLIQYPVFEWAWDNFNSSDIRACVFKTNVLGAGGPGTRLTCWDDGGERMPFPSPSEGYFNITMSFPNGTFMLSLYGDNEEGAGVYRDNQTIIVTDTAGNILSVATMNGTEFSSGMYVNFGVCGPTTIIIQVKKSLTSVNALLSGIFVDKLTCKEKTRCPGSTCFWMTQTYSFLGCNSYGYNNYGYNNYGWGYCGGCDTRISKTMMLNYLDNVSQRCPEIFGYLGSLSGNALLKEAYNILKYSGYSMLQKAKAQYLALLLNTVSGRFSEKDVVGFYLYNALKSKYPSIDQNDYPFTLGALIDVSCQNILTNTNLAFTISMLSNLNDGYTAIVLVPA